MMERRLYLAAYDVADPPRLQRMLAVVKRYATGGQKSVFECLLTEAERRRLLAATREEMDDAVDRFLLLRLDPRCKPQLLGLALPPADPEFFYYG
ncbi:MAG: CRISPR-associated endonuclease Cas2 [Zetaproteobacteria bacterium]|nr:MAG: CRISPR-associated endonuclease Cas2 [Zetaproteobacteria bacterium]